MCYRSVYYMNKPSGISVVHYGWKSFTWSHFLLRLTLLSAGSVPAGKTTRVSSGTAAAALTLRGWASTWASPAGSCMVSVTPVWRQWCSSSPQSASSVQVWHTVYIITAVVTVSQQHKQTARTTVSVLTCYTVCDAKATVGKAMFFLPFSHVDMLMIIFTKWLHFKAYVICYYPITKYYFHLTFMYVYIYIYTHTKLKQTMPKYFFFCFGSVL